jgi:hypothetical protein
VLSDRIKGTCLAIEATLKSQSMRYVLDVNFTDATFKWVKTVAFES